MPRNIGWFRVYDRMIDSPQILELSMAERGLLVSLWCLSSANDGEIPYSARQLRRRLFAEDWPESDFADILTRFEDLHLLERTADGWRPCKWMEHQYSKPSDRPESTAERKRQQRDRERERDTLIESALSGVTGGVTLAAVTPESRACHANVTPTMRVEEKSLDTEEMREEREGVPVGTALVSAPPDLELEPVAVVIEKSDRSPVKRFVPPIEEEVRALFAERGYPGQGAAFLNYYRANGWKVGRNPMKDWKAAALQWIIRQQEFSRGSPGAADSHVMAGGGLADVAAAELVRLRAKRQDRERQGQ